ncbi:MAG: hypothetical protein OXC94_10375 [Chloroflexi bacterium]|nr:hypothetical protein [Chloroflexota bacterium]
MSQQYVATDSRSGLQVAVTAEFPEDPADRVRIARTSTLFTRLMATILGTAEEQERRARFRAVETQLEIAEALISGDQARVRELIRASLQQMGISEEQLAEAEREIRERLAELGKDVPEGALWNLLGEDDAEGPDEDADPDGPQGEEPPGGPAG